MENTLYVIGGELTPRTPLPAEVYSYDTRQQTWQHWPASGSQPRPILGHSTTAIDSSLYMFGGRIDDQQAETPVNELHVYDTKQRTWSKVKPAYGEPPEPRSYHAAASIGPKLYIFGGCGEHGRLHDLHEYDSTTSSWQILQSYTAVKASAYSLLSFRACSLTLLVCQLAKQHCASRMPTGKLFVPQHTHATVCCNRLYPSTNTMK